MRKNKTTVLSPVHRLNRARTSLLTLALMGSAGALGNAGAQTATSSVADINFSTWIQALQTSAVSVFNSAGPALFALMAVIGGVYFVWNRVRSLW